MCLPLLTPLLLSTSLSLSPHSPSSPSSPSTQTLYLIIHPSLCWNGGLMLSICVCYWWGSKGKACHSLFTLLLSTSSPFQQNPESGSTQLLNSKISLHAGAPTGLRRQEEVSWGPWIHALWILETLGHDQMYE